MTLHERLEQMAIDLERKAQGVRETLAMLQTIDGVKASKTFGGKLVKAAAMRAHANGNGNGHGKPQRKTPKPATNAEKEAVRAHSAKLLGLFDPHKSRTIDDAGVFGPDRKKIGILVAHGYLKKRKDGSGLQRTAKPYVIGVSRAKDAKLETV